MSKSTSFHGTRHNCYAASEKSLEAHFNNRYKSEKEAQEKRAWNLAEFAAKCPNPLLHLKYGIDNLAEEANEGETTAEYARTVANLMLCYFEKIMPGSLDNATKLELMDDLNRQLDKH